MTAAALRPRARAPQWFTILWRNKKARFGMLLLLAFVLLALLAPVIAPYDPRDRSFAGGLPPSAAHWFGTTGKGYDVASQAIFGARTSLVIGLVAGAIATAISLLVGMTAGYLGGMVDEVLSFATNLALVVPALPLMITLAAYVPGGGSEWMVIIVISITGWAGAARLKRAQILTLRNREYIQAARMAGDGTFHVIFREIAPNMTSLIVVGFIGAVGGAIGAEAGLAFLGIGNPDTISWGTMLYWANTDGALLTGAFARLVVPGLLLALLTTALTFVNFGVDALSNPHLREP
ncbi:ABC transporter permease [Cellulomonas sp. ACRRI]|uniref:ABC transporter permease n=1 Tax=Cellulomonas sp. ACRRI TaxID=2918188 RepID=UPI001EF245C3|nr:ABC transporter permease [Cellulomonas sp. ACRRI]MCG7287554.1 ABC transporter permease [Cellulomonas sp. ACRRI]